MTNISFMGQMYIVQIPTEWVEKLDYYRMEGLDEVRNYFGIPNDWIIRFRYSYINPQKLSEKMITIDILSRYDRQITDSCYYGILWVPSELSHMNGWEPKPRTIITAAIYQPTPKYMVWDDAREAWLWINPLSYDDNIPAFKINSVIFPLSKIYAKTELDRCPKFIQDDVSSGRL